MVLKDKLLDDSAGLQSKCNLLPGTGFVLKCQHSQCKCALCFQCVHNQPISELSVKSPARMNSKKTWNRELSPFFATWDASWQKITCQSSGCSSHQRRAELSVTLFCASHAWRESTFFGWRCLGVEWHSAGDRTGYRSNFANDLSLANLPRAAPRRAATPLLRSLSNPITT